MPDPFDFTNGTRAELIDKLRQQIRKKRCRELDEFIEKAMDLNLVFENSQDEAG